MTLQSHFLGSVRACSGCDVTVLGRLFWHAAALWDGVEAAARNAPPPLEGDSRAQDLPVALELRVNSLQLLDPLGQLGCLLKGRGRRQCLSKNIRHHLAPNRV